jgi:hypothetical protein
MDNPTHQKTHLFSSCMERGRIVLANPEELGSVSFAINYTEYDNAQYR